MEPGKNSRHDHCCQNVDPRAYQSLRVGTIVPRNSARKQWQCHNTQTHLPDPRGDDTNKVRKRIDKSDNTRNVCCEVLPSSCFEGCTSGAKERPREHCKPPQNTWPTDLSLPYRRRKRSQSPAGTPTRVLTRPTSTHPAQVCSRRRNFQKVVGSSINRTLLAPPRRAGRLGEDLAWDSERISRTTAKR